MLVAVDLGGTNVKVLLARPDGVVLDSAVMPWVMVDDVDGLAHLLESAGARLSAVRAIAITGGRHRRLPSLLGDTPIVHVDELTAIGRGGLIAAGVERALVMSMGTGTAMVAAGPEGVWHLGGTAVGGGTVLGLARLLLGTVDPEEIGRLAEAGDPRHVDRSVGDIVGGSIGIVPADMPAAHFGRVAQPSFEGPVAREDIAAGLMELVGQSVGRLGLMAARAHGFDLLVVTGHAVEWAGIRAALNRVSGLFGGRIVVPLQPGLATARGALAVLVAQDEPMHRG